MLAITIGITVKPEWVDRWPGLVAGFTEGWQRMHDLLPVPPG
ncbi:hypothetical protein JOF53_001008 [Crossiella equi]|uniref:Uncharacterized protein n=1 Tax=Crossiella equi TaxID=130796 RepID=A0ABS5A6F8_9PSEU|nr:hypothetical protein [Crossiella equi]MBP2472136.1 hypothetical protein [Crossiella equi]